MPNSCSIRTSEAASTAKPAIAVTPDAATAAPVEPYVRRSASPGSQPAARSSRKRAASSTANSVEMAITSAPSVADIGFSGIRSANRTSADQPVASAIGTSGTSARSARRYTHSSTRPDGHQPRDERAQPPPRRGQGGVGLRREHRQPGHARGHARRRVEPRAHALDHGLVLVERGQSQAEGQVRGAAVARHDGLGEVGRHRAEQRVDARARGRRIAAEEVGQGERRAQRRAPAAVLGGVALVGQHALLIAAHPGDDGRVGDVAPLDDHVDLAGHARGGLQRVEVAHGRQVLRDQRGQVGAHLRARVGDPAQRGQHERERQHAPRAADARVQHPPPERRQQLSRATLRAGEGAVLARRGRACARRPARRSPPAIAKSSATPIPTTSWRPNPRTIGTGDSSSTRKPAAVASAAVAIVASAAARAWTWIA